MVFGISPHLNCGDFIRNRFKFSVDFDRIFKQIKKNKKQKKRSLQKYKKGKKKNKTQTRQTQQTTDTDKGAYFSLFFLNQLIPF